jgi:hypothetical protein
MRASVLFIVAEAGPAAYFAPLWRRWLERGMTGWSVLAEPAARHRIETAKWRYSVPVFPADGMDEEGIARAITATMPERLVVSATGHGLEAAAIRAARTRQLRVEQFIDNWYGYQRRLNAAAMPDRIYVIDQAAAQEAVAEGVPAELLTAIGHPAWEAARKLPTAPASRATFLSAPVARHYGRRLGYDERDAWAMAQEAARAWPALVSDLVFAAHPAERAPTDHGCVDGETAITAAGTVFGMFASPMVDALLSGRRVISLQPGALGPDFCPLSRHRRIARATTMDELHEALLSEPPKEPSDLRGALAGSCERWASELEAAR